MPSAACGDRPASPPWRILALAVGIGGNTAIFSVIDATRVQAIPYADPERLVYLIGNARRDVVERRGASYPDFVDWRAQQTGFEDLAAFDSQLMTLAGIDETERIDTEFVSASYFSLLGVTPALGRTFQARRRSRVEAVDGDRPERRPLAAPVRRRPADPRPSGDVER